MFIDHRDFKQDVAPEFDKETSEMARVPSAIGYLMFFVPLVINPDSKFATYHANQSLVLTFWNLFGSVLVSLIPYVGFYLMLMVFLFGIVFGIRGIVLALQGKARRVPLIGKLVILEYEDKFTSEL